VIIATPPATHFKLARSAFASGKDVLVTKPPTQTTEELKTLIRLANHHHRIFMMDSTFVYSTPIRKIKDLLDNGLFPNIRFIQSLRYGDDLRLHHVSRLRNTMLANKINVIQDLLFHDIAILNYLLPEKDLKLRAVHTVNMLAENICDTAFIHLDTDIFPIHVGLSWTIPDRRRELLISDKEKLLIFDDLKPDNKLTLFWIEEKREEVIEHGKEEPLFMVVDHFLKCVQKRTTPITDGTYMLNVMKSFQSIIDFSQ
jgi:predicted dehydrogenase